MSKEMRKQINKVNNFGQFLNESKKEKIFINGFEYYLDREKLLIYDKEHSKDGISIYSKYLTKNEREQILDYIKYGRKE